MSTELYHEIEWHYLIAYILIENLSRGNLVWCYVYIYSLDC